MYELIQVSESCYYIESPAKIGLVRLNETDVCLIDSGSDKDAGRKVRQHLDKNGWRLTAIYNGGFPPAELRHKFLMAQPSDAHELTADVLPKGFELLPLPGHFFDMAGFRTAEDVVYLADCLSSRETLDKYQIPFIYDVAAYLTTLETVKTMQARMFVPAHAAAAEDVSQLAQYNIDKVQQVADRILTLCAQPLCSEVLLQKLFTAYGLDMTFQQYALVGSTVRSFLSWLKGEGRLTAEFADNMLLWRAV